MNKPPFGALTTVSPYITPLRQSSKKTAKTAAARSKAYRDRKKQRSAAVTDAASGTSLKSKVEGNAATIGGPVEPFDLPSSVTPHVRPSSEPPGNTGRKRTDFVAVTPSRQLIASVLLSATAFALSVVGIAINGWFAQSLGSSDFAGWLFLAVGVSADLAALVLPYSATNMWYAGRRAIALLGWLVWFVTFIFAVTASIGFASSNIADVTLSRSSRVTPAVRNAETMLADAMTARDRECRGGVGKFCREREASVAERRHLLDAAIASVGQAADPQTDAAIKLLAWISGGTVRPTPNDFAMFRFFLFALLPQMGGLLLLVGRRGDHLHPEHHDHLKADVRFGTGSG